MKYAPSATAQRLIEAKALPPDSSTPGLLDPRTPRPPDSSTPGLLDAVSPEHGAQRPTPSENPRSPSLPTSTARRDVFSSTTCSSATSSTATPVHTLRPGSSTPPLCDSRMSRAVRSRASAVSLSGSNVRRRRRLRPARRPPSSAHRARCRCKMAHGTPGTVGTDLSLPPPDFTGLREIGDVRARFVITVRQCVCPTLAYHRPVKINSSRCAT